MARTSDAGKVERRSVVPDIVDRLERVIRRHVLDSLPKADRAKLASELLPSLLIEYRVWRRRFVAPVPRQIHRSRELARSPEATEHHTVLAAIEGALRDGRDITPHLSRRVCRIARDRLLADWGIHHLHLSTTLCPDGFVERTGDVLFAAFTDSDAYLLGVFAHPKHANWAAEDIFAVLVRNWPNSGLVHQARGVIAVSSKPTDDDRRALRNAGVASIMEIDGKVYVPGGIGMTTAGTPIEATRAANAFMWELRAWRDDPHGRLRHVEGVTDDAYWVPAVHVVTEGFEEWAGFGAGSTFVPVARIV